jgi:cytochrome c oxidase subunit 1
VGSVLLAAGLVVALWAFVRSLRSGARAPANPWGGATLEWATTSPPPHDNFAVPPRGARPYDYTGLRHVSEEAGWAPVRKEGAP